MIFVNKTLNRSDRFIKKLMKFHAFLVFKKLTNVWTKPISRITMLTKTQEIAMIINK